MTERDIGRFELLGWVAAGAGLGVVLIVVLVLLA